MDPRADEAFARAARRLGALTEEQLRECRQLQRDSRIMLPLSRIVLDNAYLAKEEFFAVLAESNRVIERDMERRSRTGRRLELIAIAAGGALFLIGAAGLVYALVRRPAPPDAPPAAKGPDPLDHERLKRRLLELEESREQEGRSAAQPHIDLAKRALEEAIRELYRNSADPRQIAQKLHAAIEHSTAAEALHPRSSTALHIRGRARMLLGDFEQAENDLTHALETSSSSTQILYDRGRVRIERWFAGGGMTLDPDLPDAGSTWKPLAADDFRRALDLGLHGPEGALAEATLAYHREGSDAAMVRCSDALWSSTSHEELHRFRGELLLSRDDPSGALVAFSRALESRAHYAQARYGRAMAHLRLKNFREAAEDLSVCIEWGLCLERSFYHRGRALFELKRYSAALLDFNKCLELGIPCAEKVRTLVKEAEAKTKF